MKKHLLPIIISLIASIIILGSPSERQFLNRLRADYGMIHGNRMSVESLKQIGSTKYQSYLLWSTYNYAYGKIEVSYFGIAFMTFYLGSNADKPPTKDLNQQISSL